MYGIEEFIELVYRLSTYIFDQSNYDEADQVPDKVKQLMEESKYEQFKEILGQVLKTELTVPEE